MMDLPGFEPGAFRMQSERDTTTLQTLVICPATHCTLNTRIHSQQRFASLYGIWYMSMEAVEGWVSEASMEVYEEVRSGLRGVCQVGKVVITK